MAQRLAGVHGDLRPVDTSCKGTVQHLTFFDDDQRGALRVCCDKAGTETEMRLALDLGFRVIASTAQGVESQFDDEEFHTATSALVVWQFRPLSAPDRFCWHRVDWMDDSCINMVQRCEDDVPIS